MTLAFDFPLVEPRNRACHFQGIHFHHIANVNGIGELNVLEKHPVVDRVDHMKYGVLVEEHGDVSLIGAFLVQKVDRNIATIAAEFADVFKVRFDQTVHDRHLLVFLLSLLSQRLHRITRNQTIFHPNQTTHSKKYLY